MNLSHPAVSLTLISCVRSANMFDVISFLLANLRGDRLPGVQRVYRHEALYV
jgi:hypothetical protein